MSNTNAQQTTPDNQVDQNLVGIRGWLIFPAIGFVVGPLLSIGGVLVELMSLGQMMSMGYGPYALIAIVVHIGILFYIFVGALRFFKKRQNAPQTCIRLIVVQLVASIILFILGLVTIESVDTQVLLSLLRDNNFVVGIIGAAIWVPYFRVSKRVRATFVHEEHIFQLPYKIVLPIRYLLRRRITYFAVLAVALCVFIVVVVMTVMTGLVRDFRDKNHSFTGDCIVGTESLVGFAYYEDFIQALETTDFVEATSPVIKNYALLSPQGKDLSVGIEIMGIDPVRHSRATGFGDSLHYRKAEVSKAFEPSYDANLPGCVLGIDLALERDASSAYSYTPSPARIGFSMSCFPLTARGAPAGAGTSPVITKTFYYSDHSHSGLARVDSAVVYLPLEQAQLLCMSGSLKRAGAIHIKFKPKVKVRAGREKVADLWRRFKQEKADADQAYLLETVTVQDWKDYGRTFIAAMEKEQTMMTAMFGFVGITTVFIVFVVFYMLISHKSKDIGILKSIGASNGDIMGLFGGFAFLIGLLGSCLGLFGGWLFLLRINRIESWLFERFGFQLWDRTIYAIGEIPSRMDAAVLGLIAASAIAACLVGALLPSWRAVRSSPVETLQVNQL